VVPLTQLFYSTMFFWVILLIGIPLITMRLFAHEKYTGTFETLMTVPVNEWSIVLGKFIAAYIFYLITWLPLLLDVWYVHKLTLPEDPIDFYLVGSTFLGIAILGLAHISAGVLASSLTKYQVTAGMLSFAFSLTLFLISFLKYSLGNLQDWRGELISYICQIEHMEDYVRGLLDTKTIVYYIGLSAIFIFLTVRVLETQRWK
ncbi:MAG: ABC transporter permease, partial [Sulfolobales archaeon]